MILRFAFTFRCIVVENFFIGMTNILPQYAFFRNDTGIRLTLVRNLEKKDQAQGHGGGGG